MSVDEAIARLERRRGDFVDKRDLIAALQDLDTAVDEVSESAGATSPFFNVLDYGVDNTDGGTLSAQDNRAAINALIQNVTAAGGGVIYFPAGTYLVTGTGTASAGAILLADNITLVGAGMGVTVIKCADTVDAKLSGIIRTPSAVENSNIRIQDLTIDGGTQTGTGDVTCFYAGVTPGNRELRDRDILLLRVECKNGYNGVDEAGYGFDPHEVCERITFIDCLARDNDQDGFVLDGCVDFILEGCRSFDNGRHGFNFVTETFNGEVNDCHGWGNADQNLIVQSSSHDISVIGGSYRANVAAANIRIRGNGTVKDTNILLDGLRIESGATHGVQITGANYNTVMNCFFKNNGQLAGATYDDVNITVDGSDTSSFNTITSNTMIALLTNKTRYGVREEAGGGDNNASIMNRTVGQTQSVATSMNGGTSSYNMGITGSNFFFGRTTTGRMTLQNAGRFRFASANVQTTVGAAGAASALPAQPTRYLRFEDSDGTALVVPAYLAS